MITVGDKRATLFRGDCRPASLYIGDRKITGYSRKKLTGRGQVGWEAPYKAELPSVAVKGEGEQEKLTGKNLLDPSVFANRNDSYSNSYDIADNTLTIIRADYQAWDNINTILNTKSGSYCFLLGVGYYLEIELDSSTDKIVIKDGQVLSLAEGAYKFKALSSDGSYPVSGRLPMMSLTPTPYEPYCGGIPAPNPQYPIEPQFLADISVASRSRNLFDSELVPDTVVAGGVTLVNNHDGSFTANGTATYDYSRFYYADITDKLVDGAFYTSYSSSAKVLLGLEMLDKKSRAFVSFNTSPIKVDKVHYTYRVSFQLNSKEVVGTVEDEVAWLQIVASKVKEPYEPYYDGGTAQLPILRALPDGSVRDEIDVVTGTVTRRIFELVLDGTEIIYRNAWYWDRYGLEAYQVTLHHSRPLYTATDIICSHFIPGGRFGSNPGFQNCLWWYENGFVVKTDGKQSAEDFVSWLSQQYADGTPVTIWYALANPIIEHYDPAILRQHPGYTQLIQQGGFREAEIEAEFYKET